MQKNDLSDCSFHATDINRRLCAREVPMKILVLGMPRTGTCSLMRALKYLGYYDAYHGYDAIFKNPRDCEMWYAALCAKYDGIGKVFGREEFDKLLGHCQAVFALPALCLAEDLVNAYPDAKVILTYRDVDEWHQSVKQTIVPLVTGRYQYLCQFMDNILLMRTRWIRPTFRKSWQILFKGNFDANARYSFEEHYKAMQSLVPSSRLLLYHVEEGWTPLCRFLGVPIPQVPMPRGNERKALREKFRRLMRHMFWEYLVKAAKLVTYTFLAFTLWNSLC
ncbi:sulfotransferase family protein [Aspergillus novofumigatus IBT 16806]|uniref:NAD dependent epimerase/dehydratase n=1 Tax=Aspergillus novofumigatus (strain IBT 16806) TaxID=1392255 RepID=A0A2I1BWZ6_ASPN1|nr:uncharacterized protein P174DRAFT_464290 [Aspergillus novofumigatus IBT 16806]PKX89898.1 hypothetical protein P174DRAFT_464290 [Aspergillus novofumigatus IBT 16806]